MHYRYGVPVHSVLVLLRPMAHHRRLDKGVHYGVWRKRGRTDFGFEVIRLWKRPVDRLLTGGLGTLPLAPLGQLPPGATLEEALPAVLRRIDERLSREARPEDAAKLWAATFVLSGLRLTREEALAMFQGVHGMKESTTYQYILDEGRADGIRKVLLRQGHRRFGAPDEAITTRLEGITDLERLERMTDRVYEVSSWQELIDTL